MLFSHTLRDGDWALCADPSRVRSEAATPPRILVVDDDGGALGALEKLLSEEGFVTAIASDGEAALVETRRALPDAVLTDLQMPRMHGIELCQRLHEIDPDLPVIVMTAHSDMHSVIDSLRAGAQDYLIKPLDFDAVLWRVQRAIARRAAKLELEEVRRTLNERLVLSSIREQEHAEAEERHRVQLNMLLENLSEGVAIGDHSGRILMMNDAARTILGLGDEDLATINANPPEAWNLEGHPLEVEQCPLRRASRGEQVMDYELYVRSNGQRRRIVATGTSVRDENGNVVMAIVLFRDVTEIRRLEQQREEYLALTSHDLRNPLNVILMSAALLRGSLTEKGPAADLIRVELLERNAKRMTAMLEELTEATSLESRGIELRRAECDLRRLVAGVVDCLDAPRAERITIEADALPYVVLADASRLERVVTNLLTNALKYSAEDAPVIARLARKESYVELDVIDRGIGIAPESLKMLFDRYYRTTAGKARASGLGLVLYIARLIIEAHGGRIDVSSMVGEGSTFRLTLPSHAGPVCFRASGEKA